MAWKPLLLVAPAELRKSDSLTSNRKKKASVDEREEIVYLSISFYDIYCLLFFLFSDFGMDGMKREELDSIPAMLTFHLLNLIQEVR